MQNAPASPESALADLVSLWQRRRAEGQPATPAELCRDRPELLAGLERRIAALERMNGLAEAVGETCGRAPLGTSPLPGPASFTVTPGIPGFELLSVLGRGGMGVVYQARDAQLKRLVALKMVLAGAHSSEDSRGRFRAEAEAIARLQHPHVVQVFSWGEHNGLPYLVMEYVAGGGLDRRIANQPQPPSDAARLVMLLARAVQAAHKAGVVHRDLKPANVLLAPAADEPALNTAYGWPKVSDFGLARLSGGSGAQTATFDVLGTPAYMAPEQAAGKAREVGPAADVYALGAILYELLTGRPPFKGESLLETLDQVRSLPPRPPRQLGASVPPVLEGVCLRCLAKSPHDRPATAADLAADLQRFLEGQPMTLAASVPAISGNASAPAAACLPEAITAPAGWKRRWSWWLPLAATTLFIAAGIGLTAFLGRRSGEPPGESPGAEAEAAVAAPKELKILRLEVTHFPTVNGGRARPRLLGRESFLTHCDDSVKAEARLSRPAYAFLIAFRPDGTDEVLFPEKEGQPPPLTDHPGYPSESLGFSYGLEEGAGLQALALVASGQPLPAYREWRSQCPPCPWGKHEAPPEMDVVWRADGMDDVEALTADPDDDRAKGKAVPGRTPVARLAGWLRRAPQVETVQVLGFAVVPKDR